MAQGVKKKPAKKKYRKQNRNLRTRTKDIDQVHDDIRSGFRPELSEDLPSFGQHYCVSCARHFISKDTLERHQSSKPHKRRLKEALKTPFTERDSLLAAEMTVDEPHRRVAADDVML